MDFITLIDESDEYHSFRAEDIRHIHWGGLLTSGDVCLTTLFDANGEEIISIDHRVQQNKRTLNRLIPKTLEKATFDLSGNPPDSDDSDDEELDEEELDEEELDEEESDE